MPFAAIFVALAAGVLAEIWNPPPHRRWPLLTLLLAAAIFWLALFEESIPGLRDIFARDPRMIAGGEVWRGLTSLLLTGNRTNFFLVMLVILGTAVERRTSRSGWLAVYFGGGFVASFAALLWEPVGGGSSLGCMALAGYLCSDWREGRWRAWRVGLGLTGLVAASLLVLERDIHGAGFMTGLAVGFVLAALERRREAIVVAENVVPFRRSETLH